MMWVLRHLEEGEMIQVGKLLPISLADGAQGWGGRGARAWEEVGGSRGWEGEGGAFILMGL